MTLLVLLQFTVRSHLGGDRIAPDFLLLALLIYTIRAEPERAPPPDSCSGLLRDALTPASLRRPAPWRTRWWDSSSSWAKAVFFAEHVFVKGCLFFAGRGSATSSCARLRKLQGSQVAWELLVWSPLQGLTTAVVGVAVLWFFRGWLSPRRRVGDPWGPRRERVSSTPCSIAAWVGRAWVWIVLGS